MKRWGVAAAVLLLAACGGGGQRDPTASEVVDRAIASLRTIDTGTIVVRVRATPHGAARFVIDPIDRTERLEIEEIPPDQLRNARAFLARVDTRSWISYASRTRCRPGIDCVRGGLRARAAGDALVALAEATDLSLGVDPELLRDAVRSATFFLVARERDGTARNLHVRARLEPAPLSSVDVELGLSLR